MLQAPGHRQDHVVVFRKKTGLRSYPECHLLGIGSIDFLIGFYQIHRLFQHQKTAAVVGEFEAGNPVDTFDGKLYKFWNAQVGLDIGTG